MKINHFLHRNFLFLLILSYLLAAYFPALGLAAHHCVINPANLPVVGNLKITAPSLMLALLLFNAGLGVRTAELQGLIKKTSLLWAGLLVNLIVPILFVSVLLDVLKLWHSGEELQNILMGLALIIAMPIAGSSSAWTQNVNGNISLTLGLVLCSTFLSPIVSPYVFRFFSLITSGDYSEDLGLLAQQHTSIFMSLIVVLPSILGIGMHYLLGEKNIQKSKSYLKVINFSVLLFLNYCNGSSTLPQTFKQGDLDFLAFIFLITLALTLACFGSGWLLAKLLRAGEAEKASLMFALGMSNNGSALVLASITIPDHPAAMLPLIAGILIQQIVAAAIDRWIFKDDAK